MVKEVKKEKILCPNCNVITNHKLIWKSELSREEDEDAGIWEEEFYELFACMGCESPTLKKSYFFSEDMEPTGKINKEGREIWDIVPKITLWPKRSSNFRKIKYYYDLDMNTNRIYREVIDAYNNETYILCAIGIRAIIESICNKESILGDSLMEKIDKMQKEGMISEKMCKALHANRVIGNISAHETKMFSEYTLLTAIDLIESLLDYNYNSETRGNILNSNTSR